MNKSQAIFQEIENKLVKDDYASSLPNYHPAKGRRKRVLKEPLKVYQTHSNKNGQHPVKSQEPDTSPEIEDPDEEEIQPDRDYPGPEIDPPEEEELPEEEPYPEYDDPDEEEFKR